MTEIAAGRFVVRIRGYHYDRRGEVAAACWLTKDGGACSLRSGAQVFETEDEAWFYMALSGNMGDDEHGEWCWVEDASLSAVGDVATVTMIGGKPVAPGSEPYEVS